jgi:serine/threonine protein kinase
VSSKPPKDAGPPSPDDASASADGLLTSEDLFGDLIDAPLEPKPVSARPAATTPIRVQVNDEGEAGPPKPKAPDVSAEDMGALLDAFGGPEDSPSPPEPAPPAAAQPPAPPPPAPKPQAKPSSPLLAAADEDMDGLLDVLGGGDDAAEAAPAAAARPEPPATPEPEPPVEEPSFEPVAAEASSEIDVGLDGLLDAPPAEPPPPPALPATGDSAKTLAPGKFMSPFAHLAELAAEPPKPPKPPKTSRPPTDLDSLLEGVLSPQALLDSETRARTDLDPPVEEKPVSRLGTRFAAADPQIASSGTSRMMIDLAGLAEDALTMPAPVAPGERVGTRSGVGDVYGPYTLVERIAAGGMAEVFKAKRSGVEGFEKVVAVKRILPHLSDNKEFVDMFIDEAKVVAGLNHPNIVQILDLGRLDETYFIAMEYVHGRDLRTIERRAKDKGLRLPLDLSAYVVSRVCSALEHAHKRKDDQGRAMRVVHRDISPQNILISFEGDVKLTDFGIAKATTKATSTDKGSLRGKLLYMSPEQASGQPMDRRSDIFSLGIVFYELMTERKPFMGTSEKGILDMVRECRVDPPTKWNDRIPERLEKIVLKALDKNPDDRYQDAGEMHRDLERAIAEMKPTTALELARLMELLFERDERGVREAPEEASGEAAFEIDFDEGKERPDDVNALLKKHGIG